MPPIDQLGAASVGVPLLQREEQLSRIESALAAAREGLGSEAGSSSKVRRESARRRFWTKRGAGRRRPGCWC
jgi:hypothetical protein